MEDRSKGKQSHSKKAGYSQKTGNDYMKARKDEKYGKMKRENVHL